MSDICNITEEVRPDALHDNVASISAIAKEIKVKTNRIGGELFNFESTPATDESPMCMVHALEIIRRELCDIDEKLEAILRRI